MCDSCRLGAGNDLVPWAFIPTRFLQLPDGSPLPLSLNFGTLKSFSSSKGVTRHFCGTCGAIVFFYKEGRSEVVDVAVGVLGAESGAMALDWLKWDTSELGYTEDGVKRDLMAEDVHNGMKEWAKKHNL